MANEIPDSDEESDFDSAPRAASPPFARENNDRHSLNIGDRGLDINFDDFISQTQSAKDGSSQLEQMKRSTASTQKHLQEALANRRGSANSSYDGANDIGQSSGNAQLTSSITRQRKRAYSEINHDQRGSSQNRSKRTKTYGSSTRRLASSPESKEPSGIANPTQTASPDAFAQKSSSQALQEQDEEDDVVPRARNKSKRFVSLLGQSVSNVGHVLSTSKSSMGGYQSINLDFRGSGTGLDINANPFGALTQVSVDAGDELNGEDTRADLSSTLPLSASPRRPGRDAISPLTDAGFEPRPTTGVSVSIDPSLLVYVPPDESQMLTSPAATRVAETSASIFATASNYDPYDAHLEAESEKNHVKSGSITKKGGRKPKDSRHPSIASIPDEIADLQDEDQLVIGLPKEQYKPRPSKSRGGTIEPEQQSQQGEEEAVTRKKDRKKSIKSAIKPTENNLLAKIPSSELNLSDEAIIGLPKENYKPRTSRRRSRMIVEEAEASIEVDAGSAELKDGHDQSKPSELSQAIIEVVESPIQKPKKGKKAKVKRAKTSAAGLLKKSEPMISDGEEDVVWMDTKPAIVKLDLPADLLAGKTVKKENTAELMAGVGVETSKKSVEAFQEISIDPQPARLKTVTVEIPARVEQEESKSKKPGRKHKTATDEEDDDNDRELEPNTDLSTSTHAAPLNVLNEKDKNTPLPLPTPKKQTNFSSPTKPTKITHSPINPSGGKVLYRVGLSRRSAIPPLLKIVKPPPKPQQDKENFDEEGRPIDLVAETMKKWREMGALD